MERGKVGDKVIAEVERGRIIAPSATIFGVYDCELWRGGELVQVDHSMNKVQEEGLNTLLDTMKTGSTSVKPWYVSIFQQDIGTVTATDWTHHLFYDTTWSGGSAPSTLPVEFATYTEGTSGSGFSRRPEWVNATASGGATTNSANKAQFDFTGGATLYGAMLASDHGYTFPNNHDAAYKMISVSKFSSPITVISGDTLKVTISLTFTPL